MPWRECLTRQPVWSFATNHSSRVNSLPRHEAAPEVLLLLTRKRSYNDFMPRRHKPVKHSTYRKVNNEASKRRYPSKITAERAAEVAMLQYPGLELSVYQGSDRGWYLTRRNPEN
jgi:hypothetical protein